MEKYDLILNDDMCFFWAAENREWVLHIQSDEDALDPRKEYDNVSTMACFHNRYSLGDDIGKKDPGAFWRDLVERHFTNDELEEKIRCRAIPSFEKLLADDGVDINDMNAAMTVLAHAVGETQIGRRIAMDLLKDTIEYKLLYLYDHSGLTMSCDGNAYPYNDRFDSSVVGWCVVEKEDAINKLGATEDNWRERAAACIRDEVAAYDHYLRGDVWLFDLKSRYNARADWNDIDSCGCFIGDSLVSSGIIDAVGHDFKAMLEAGKVKSGRAVKRVSVVWDYECEGR